MARKPRVVDEGQQQTLHLVGRRLQQALTEQKLSQNDLASAMGVSRAAVALWVSGQNVMDIVRLMSIARVLKKPVGWFFDESSDSDTDAYTKACGVEQKIDAMMELVRDVVLPANEPLKVHLIRLAKRADAVHLLIESLTGIGPSDT